MATAIRLTKVGRKGESRYRVVVKEKRSKRDGKAIEILGWFQKTTKGHKKQVDMERYKYWVSKGAQPSLTVLSLMQE